MAMYITPENIASIVSARASGESGTMSLRPTPDSVLKLRNSSSIHVRGCGGTDTSLKLPGTQAWQAENAYANAHASRVKVVAADTSSSVATPLSPSMYRTRPETQSGRGSGRAGGGWEV